MANEHAHNHGHVLTHEHDDYGSHDHHFSHSHDHKHGDDGSNEHETHEHIELVGPVFLHKEHHTSADDPSVMIPPGEEPPPDRSMNKLGEPSKEIMDGPDPISDVVGKTRSIWWGEV